MSIAEIPADAPRPRHCTLKKWPDFPGFGFNLHAEKDKAGQFIGKVDDDSPAFYAGVRSGDRVVEVGEVNIGTESHSQVVQRIRNIAGEGKDVTLLLLDHEADIYYQEKDLVVNSSWANVEYHETPVPRPGTKKNENIVAGVMALEINSENEQVPEVEIPADGVVITSRTTTIYVEPEEPEEPEEIIVVVENDVESDVPVEDDDEAVVIVTVTAPEESTPVDVEPVLHDSEQTNGVEEAVNGEIEPEVVVVAESAPTPPPEPEVEEVKTEVVQVAVVETTITHVETNNIESVPEPDYIPEPEPVPEPETTIIVTTQTTVVESTPTQNDDEPKSNGEVNNMLNMSAKEYREYLKTHGKASAKNKAYNFKQKKDMFDHL